MTARLQVAGDQLQAAAARWHALATELACTTPTVSGPSAQPTAAAMNTIHAAAAAASKAFSARIQSTAIETTTAASAYARQEASSAGKLRTITGALGV
jgi:hypothetical protein